MFRVRQEAREINSQVTKLELELANSWQDTSALSAAGGVIEHMEVQLTDLLLQLETISYDRAAAVQAFVRSIGEKLLRLKTKAQAA